MKGVILVVDDEEPTRRTLAEILRLEGFLVQTAANGQAAIEAIAITSFDVVLLDLKMPGMDGLDVLHEAVKIAPETQVILLTAHGSLESAIEVLHHGAHDYLLKPSSPEQIIRSVTDGLLKRAEFQRRRALLEQLSQSIQELSLTRANLASQANPTAGGSSSISSASEIALGNGCSVDFEHRELHFHNNAISGGEVSEGNKVPLSPTESRLLQVFIENRGRVFTNIELIARVQGYESSKWEAAEIIRPLISRLRAKLPHQAEGKSPIVNVRGKGYAFD